MNSRVKVQRTSLIAALKERRTGIKTEAIAERNALPAKEEKARTDAARMLRKLADDIERGKWPTKTYMDLPSRPVVRGASTQSLDRAIKMLELSKEEQITITAEDYGQYLA